MGNQQENGGCFDGCVLFALFLAFMIALFLYFQSGEKQNEQKKTPQVEQKP